MKKIGIGLLMIILFCLCTTSGVLAANSTTTDKNASTLDPKVIAFNLTDAAIDTLFSSQDSKTTVPPSPDITTITTPQDLIDFGLSVSQAPAHYKDVTVSLENDLQLTEPWIPITTFAGTFLGNGHTISGLSIANDESSVAQGTNLGFVALLTTDGNIQDLNIQGEITGIGNVGSIAALSQGNIQGCTFSGIIDVEDLQRTPNGSLFSGCGGIVGINNGTVVDCKTEQNTTITRTGMLCGGIVGMNLFTLSKGTPTGSITNCTNNATITCLNDDTRTMGGGTGGIVGRHQTFGVDEKTIPTLPVQISDCTNNGAITSGYSVTGGIAGQLADGKLENCMNTGTIIQNVYGLWTGGIVGSYNQNVTCPEGSTDSIFIKGCTNSGSIEAVTRVGGIVGGDENNAGGLVRSPSVLTISGCINTGKISAKGYIGGISGYSRSTISRCYNTGDLSNTLLDDKGDGYNAMGGIASRSGMPITDCFNLGNLYTQTMDPLEYHCYSGGILGIADVDSPILIRCYSAGPVDGSHTNPSLDTKDVDAQIKVKVVYYGGVLGGGRVSALTDCTFNRDAGGKASRSVDQVYDDPNTGLTALQMVGEGARAAMSAFFTDGTYTQMSDLVSEKGTFAFMPVLKDMPTPYAVAPEKALANGAVKVAEVPVTPTPTVPTEENSPAVASTNPHTGIAVEPPRLSLGFALVLSLGLTALLGKRVHH